MDDQVGAGTSIEGSIERQRGGAGRSHVESSLFTWDNLQDVCLRRAMLRRQGQEGVSHGVA